jgi:cell wall assembly regulator SMI1
VPGLTPQDISTLEAELGCVLPAEVRTKYSESDGLLGPTNCNLLYPFRSEGDTQIVRINRLMKAESWFPPALSGVAILGDDGCGNYLCFDPRQPRALIWNPADGDWVQETFLSMDEAWAYVAKLYASVA